eukprot:11114567-Karenia_brevis.AAC.1
MKVAKEGGWGADKLSLEQIDAFEPSFEHVTVSTDMNQQLLINRFKYAIHKGSNRKSAPPWE